jgi:hypothetical protein
VGGWEEGVVIEAKEINQYDKIIQETRYPIISERKTSTMIDIATQISTTIHIDIQNRPMTKNNVKSRRS